MTVLGVEHTMPPRLGPPLLVAATARHRGLQRHIGGIVLHANVAAVSDTLVQQLSMNSDLQQAAPSVGSWEDRSSERLGVAIYSQGLCCARPSLQETGRLFNICMV